jgi:hypothetical protein
MLAMPAPEPGAAVSQPTAPPISSSPSATVGNPVNLLDGMRDFKWD